MILVDGDPFSAQSSSFQSLEGSDILDALIELPISGTESFKASPAISEDAALARSTNSKLVYVFQREYATVDPALVDFVGTDEATTCVGVAIRNRRNGMTSVAHMDSPSVVDMGISQMLLFVVNQNLDEELDVHLIGGFEDVAPKRDESRIKSDGHQSREGYSYPLCAEIIECLWTRQEKFHLQTLCVLRHNTKMDSEGDACPIFDGFLVNTSNGLIIPATFDNTFRSPDETVRRIRITSSYEDPSWDGKLLETYETQTDRFKIAPCCWTLNPRRIALKLLDLSDPQILQTCSTSPSAEHPDFVDNLRRGWEYLIKHPDWRETFPKKKPRVFNRAANGSWERSYD